MRKIATLARMTLLEIIHEKIFFVFVFLSSLLLFLSFLLGSLSFDEKQKILADFGYLSVHLSGLGIALFFGSYVLAREIERQTCLLILSRPLSRSQFLFGKILGINWVYSILFIILFLLLSFLLDLFSAKLFWNHFLIVSSIWLEVTTLLALSVLFSLFVRPLIALVLTTSLYFLGEWIGDLFFFAKKAQSVFFQSFVSVLDWVVPNFYRMNHKSYYYLQEGLGGVGLIWLHFVAWIVGLMILIHLSFRRKDVV